MTIVPNTNYVFQNWTENGNVVSTNATYSFTVTENHNIVANLIFFDGINENSADSYVIYPNPAYDKLKVECQETVERYDVYTISGSLVITGDVNSNTFEVEVGVLNAGTYIIRLTNADKVKTMRFIKE